MERIGIHPTHTYGAFKLRAGRPLPFGATRVEGGINFSISSRHAVSCSLVLFHKRRPEPLAEIPFPDEFRIGNVFAMVVFDLDYEDIEYGFRMDGPYNPTEDHRFDSRILPGPLR